MTVCDRLDALVVGWVRFCDRLRSQDGAGIGPGAIFVSMSERLDAPVAGWVRFVTFCDHRKALVLGLVQICDRL